MWEAAAQVGFMGAMLVAGAVWPRTPQGLVTSDTWLNVGTGAGLFALRALVFGQLAQRVGPGLLDLSAVSHPGVQLLLIFVVTDLARYLLHRAHHRISFLWQFHRVHHSSARLDATSGLRMHVVDFIQLSLVPIVLFGLLLDVSRFEPWVFSALGLVVAAFDAFQHANLGFDTRRPLARAWDSLFNNPHFHSWHHTNDVAHFGDGNYGQALTIWDRLLGTCVSHEQACQALGLPQDDQLEPSVVGMQLLRRQRGS